MLHLVVLAAALVITHQPEVLVIRHPHPHPKEIMEVLVPVVRPQIMEQGAAAVLVL